MRNVKNYPGVKAELRTMNRDNYFQCVEGEVADPDIESGPDGS